MRISSVVFCLCAGISCSAMLDAAFAFNPLGNHDDQNNSSSSNTPSRRCTDERHAEEGNSSHIDSDATNEGRRDNRYFDTPLPPRSSINNKSKRKRSHSRNKCDYTNHFNRDERYDSRDCRYRDESKQSYDYSSPNSTRTKYSNYKRSYNRWAQDNVSDRFNYSMRGSYRNDRGYNSRYKDYDDKGYQNDRSFNSWRKDYDDKGYQNDRGFNSWRRDYDDKGYQNDRGFNSWRRDYDDKGYQNDRGFNSWRRDYNDRSYQDDRGFNSWRRDYNDKSYQDDRDFNSWHRDYDNKSYQNDSTMSIVDFPTVKDVVIPENVIDIQLPTSSLKPDNVSVEIKKDPETFLKDESAKSMSPFMMDIEKADDKFSPQEPIMPEWIANIELPISSVKHDNVNVEIKKEPEISLKNESAKSMSPFMMELEKVDDKFSPQESIMQAGIANIELPISSIKPDNVNVEIKKEPEISLKNENAKSMSPFMMELEKADDEFYLQESIIPEGIVNIELPIFSKKPDSVIKKEPVISLKNKSEKSVSAFQNSYEKTKSSKKVSHTKQRSSLSKPPKQNLKQENVEKKEAKSKFSKYTHNIENITPDECKSIGNLQTVCISNKEYLDIWKRNYATINANKRKSIEIQIKYPVKNEEFLNIKKYLEARAFKKVTLNIPLNSIAYKNGYFNVRNRNVNASETITLTSRSDDIKLESIAAGFLDKKKGKYKTFFTNDLSGINAIVLPDSVKTIENNAFGKGTWRHGDITIVMPSTIKGIAKDVLREKHALMPAIKWTQNRAPSRSDVKNFVDMIHGAGRHATDGRPFLFQFVGDNLNVLWNVLENGTMKKPDNGRKK